MFSVFDMNHSFQHFLKYEESQKLYTFHTQGSLQIQN